MTRALTLTLLAAVLATAVLPEPLSSQTPQRGRTRRIPVMLVITETLPPGGGAFVVERRPGVEPYDVIRLLPDATVEDLADAIRTIMFARRAAGDWPVERQTLRVQPWQPSHGARQPYPWVPRVLDDLKRAPEQDVAGIGRVKAVRIYLPPQWAGRRGARADPS